MEYRKEVKDPWLLAARTTTSPWTSVKHCEIIVDYRKRQVVEHALIHINRTEVDCLRRFLGGSFKFLAVHISNDFKWSTHIHTVMRTARQHLYFLTSLHHWEHSQWLHHSLVWQLFLGWPRGPTESDEISWAQHQQEIALSAGHSLETVHEYAKKIIKDSRHAWSFHCFRLQGTTGAPK